jgi:hypothetical protein
MAMGLPPVTFAVFLKAKLFWKVPYEADRRSSEDRGEAAGCGKHRTERRGDPWEESLGGLCSAGAVWLIMELLW